MAPLLGGRGIFGKRKKTMSEMEVGKYQSFDWSCDCDCDCDCDGVDDVVDVLLSSMEKEFGIGNGRLSVNFVPLASGMNSVMTFFPGRMRPNGCCTFMLLIRLVIMWFVCRFVEVIIVTVPS